MEAYCLSRDFDAAGPAEFRMDQHYLLYAEAGTLRLEAEGKRWSLPPARAAFIPARQPVIISILSKLHSASVLYDSAFPSSFPESLCVFDVSPLARELIRECRRWGADAGPLSEYARSVFATLAQVTTNLAETPSACVLPVAKSAALAKAISMTEARIGENLSFEDVARETGQSSRALARRASLRKWG